MANTDVHAPVREDWLARSEEPLAVPDIPIVDAHHHLWDRPGSRYLLGEYLRDLEQVPQVRATVYVQCRSFYLDEGPGEFRPLGEVRFVRSVAEASPSVPTVCQAVVGGADLSLGHQVERVLDAMEEDSGCRLRGIRNQTAWHADPRIVSSPYQAEPDRLLRKEFRDGVRVLGRRGLSLDVWAYHTQLGQVLALARECPETTIIVDHFGGPLGIGPYAAGSRAVLDRWHRGMDGLSRCPNVVVKLSGAGMRVFGFGFDQPQQPPTSGEVASAMAPYFDACLDRFGASRCMLASNFPVDKGMFGYRVLWNAFAECAASLPATEQHDLFHRTAERVYRLDDL
ncbi:amidohydrolase family protein [Amycolatopsis sp. FU40]|uniref:amidohydrolase family protein n=1 Tax=Amycolatopsis sp. FU40 TaxID=2914159 RepID=UPI001F2CA568|nr:amidohydrolase family protein [Amycolatopsis sp. FU40]UKD57078.1 amidohydrolase family protein [Amycolatopsis sp. FU40]